MHSHTHNNKSSHPWIHVCHHVQFPNPMEGLTRGGGHASSSTNTSTTRTTLPYPSSSQMSSAPSQFNAPYAPLHSSSHASSVSRGTAQHTASTFPMGSMMGVDGGGGCNHMMGSSNNNPTAGKTTALSSSSSSLMENGPVEWAFLGPEGGDEEEDKGGTSMLHW